MIVKSICLRIILIDSNFFYIKVVVDENDLPIPQVVVSHLRTSTISVEWKMLKPTPPYLVLTHYVILLVGTDFANNIKSDAR